MAANILVVTSSAYRKLLW